VNSLKQIVKKINFLKVAEVGLAVLITLAPVAVFALALPNCSSLGGVNCQSSTSTLSGLIIYVIQILLSIAGVLAVLFFIIGGFFYITASGNEETAEKGKSIVINAIIGLVIIILSYVIVSVISSLVTNPATSTGN
jgi:lysylphosphatidylglycerol synthetase-like protein (DUF2156 family)